MKDPDHSQNEEEKISSSSLRQRLLGTLLQPPRVRGACRTTAAMGVVCPGGGLGVSGVEEFGKAALQARAFQGHLQAGVSGSFSSKAQFSICCHGIPFSLSKTQLCRCART